MRIEAEIKLGFKDVLIRPKRSTLNSRSEVTLTRNFLFKHSTRKWTGVPIVAANMDTIGTFTMAEVLAEESMLTAIHKHYSLEEWNNFVKKHQQKEQSISVLSHIMVSTGTSNNDFDKLEKILALSQNLQFICIDVANGYSEHFVNFIKRVREGFPDKTICAGNVVTCEMVEALLLAGADIVKVGIGPGSVCTTRLKTGVGYPQLSAVIECADAAHGLKGQIISDGGCKVPGDLAKALGAGADFVMLGGMLAATDECEGKIIEEAGQKYMLFYGMSSEVAMNRHSGGIADYRAAEGKAVQVPLRGTVKNILHDMMGGLRSACTYVGACRLKELTKRTTFIRVTEQENPIFNHTMCN